MIRLKAFFLGLCLVLSGCAGAQSTGPVAPEMGPGQGPPPISIPEGQFGATVHTLLSKPKTDNRVGHLGGVVQYQLARANRYFEAGHDEAGLAAVAGGLYLVRLGEFHLGMVKGREAALADAARVVAKQGNEGRSRALYGMLSKSLPPGPELSDVKQHLRALDEWRQATRERDSMQATGAAQREAVDRALMEPSREAFDAAQAATMHWILAARAFSAERRSPPRNNNEREEWLEAYRAVRTGALTLVALALRHGNAAEALRFVEDPAVAPVVAPELQEKLGQAAEEDSPDAWAALVGVFDGDDEDDGGEIALDPDLKRAAAWGAATQLYRAEPQFQAALPLAALLMSHGMSEAVPSMLEERLDQDDLERELNWSLRFVLQAVVGYESVGDLGGARHTFAASEGLLSRASAMKASPKLRSTVATVTFVMGQIESRAGALDRARKHLVRSVAIEPTTQALALLAAIDRQRDNYQDALSSLRRIVQAAEKDQDYLTLAETHLTLSEVELETGARADAQASLEAALRAALKARDQAQSTSDFAAAERTLARVLERYHDADGARRATERAFEAARNDMRELTATVLDSSRRALTMGDVRQAREAVWRGLKANLAAEDLVYAALWLQLLERRLNIPPDGTAAEAFARIEDHAGWPAKLKQWAKGKLSDNDLLEQASTSIERVEAMFYVAMRAETSENGDSHKRDMAQMRLAKVAESDAIELVEVAIARDLLIKEPLKVSLPDGVSIP